MDYMALFTTFDGRINRAKWWLGVLVLAVVIYGLYALVFFFDPYETAIGEFTATDIKRWALPGLIITALIAWPATAISVKRLKDRDRPIWLLAIFWAPTIVNIVCQFTGIGFVMAPVDGEVVLTRDTVGWTIGTLGTLISIWMVIEFGILKGTDGANRYGPSLHAVKN